MILLIWTLLTVSTAASRPEGTIIKEGVLTYPAGSYHEKELLSLCINTYGDDNQESNQTRTLSEASEYTEPKKEDTFPYNYYDLTNIYRKYSVEYHWMLIDSFLLVGLSDISNTSKFCLFSFLGQRRMNGCQIDPIPFLKEIP